MSDLLRFPDYFDDNLLDGIYALLGFILTVCGTVLTIFFGAFVALRAFYIQKRHERMADKYDELFKELKNVMYTMADILDSKTANPTLIKQVGDAYGNMTWLANSAYVYLSPRAGEILKTYFRSWDEIKRLLDEEKKKGKDHDHTQFFEQVSNLHGKYSEACLAKLTAQAGYDLRPNLGRFWQEFWTCFFHG